MKSDFAKNINFIFLFLNIFKINLKNVCQFRIKKQN